MYKAGFLVLFVLSSFISFGQQEFEAPEYLATRIQNNLIIDGEHDQIWSLAPWSATWKDIITGEEGLYRTRFKCSWNNDFLYFFAELVEPNITATIDTNHAPLFKYDHTLEIFLDAHGDQKNYYELQINAQEARWELTLNKPYSQGGVSTSPNEINGLVYKVVHHGSLNDQSDIDQKWTVEIALPWSGLDKIDITKAPPESMRINLSRVYQTDNDVETQPNYWLWAPIGAFNIHMPERWGWLHFK